MREILFRGKCLDTGEWVEGAYLLLNGEDHRIATSCIDGDDKNLLTVCAYPVDPDTVGQYTGLDDKNGVKIFEGDILNIKLAISYDYFEHTETCRKWRSSVIYENGTFKITENGTTYPLCEYILTGIYRAWFEVIGNIHDNPELLHEEVTP